MDHVYMYMFVIDPLQLAVAELDIMVNVGVVTTTCVVIA